jgi:hypothetical protein
MTGPVPLRDKLHQAVHGFSQLAGCLCQGALVQVRPSAYLSSPASSYDTANQAVWEMTSSSRR